MGSAVKALGATAQHELGSDIGILLDLVVPQADDRPAFRLKTQGSPVVIVRGLFRMLAAVHFNRELCFAAREIDDVAIDHKLPGESGSIMTKSKPQQAFGFGGVVAQGAGLLGQLGVDAPHGSNVAGLAGARTHNAKVAGLASLAPTPGPSLAGRGGITCTPLRAS